LGLLQAEQFKVRHLMFYAVAPLVIVVGIALAFDRWNSGRDGGRHSREPNRRRKLRL
jgi:hypothetical protein